MVMIHFQLLTLCHIWYSHSLTSYLFTCMFLQRIRKTSICLPPVTFTIVLGDTQMRSYSPCILGALTLCGDTDRNKAEYKLSDYT